MNHLTKREEENLWDKFIEQRGLDHVPVFDKQEVKEFARMCVTEARKTGVSGEVKMAEEVIKSKYGNGWHHHSFTPDQVFSLLTEYAAQSEAKWNKAENIISEIHAVLQDQLKTWEDTCIEIDELVNEHLSPPTPQQ